MQVFSGLRFRLLLLVLLVCAPLVVLILHSTDEDRHRAMANWQQRSAEMLQISHSEETEMVDSARQFLLAISESSAIHARAKECTGFLREELRSYPRYSQLGIIKPDGKVIASVGRNPGPTTNFDQGFLRPVLETKTFAAGGFPVRSADGKPAITFAHPVFDRAGRVALVAFAELDAPWFTRLGSEFSFPFPKGAVWMEIDGNGKMITRYPKEGDWFGEALPEKSLLPVVFSRAEGALEQPDHTGVPYFYAFNSRPSSLTADPVVSIIGIPRQVLFAEADHLLQRNLTLLGLAAGLAFLIGWIGSKVLVLGPVQTLVRSTARLAAGDLTVRTGLNSGRGELGQLTRAFDSMVQTLEQRELERQRASQKLQLLSHRLVEVQESERRHIARELHDEIGQSLTAAEINLQAALQLPGNEALERRLEDSIQAVERVLEQVHDLSLSLRPSMLDDLGLEPALRSYTQRQAELTGMQAEFHAAHLDSRLDSMIETECFRVAQEALTNVVRHAQAKAVTVALSRKNGHLHLSVRDNGIGFDVSTLREEAVRGASLGLLSMEERASLAGGGIQFNSSPGQGTEVQAWFPLKWRSLPGLSENNHE